MSLFAISRIVFFCSLLDIYVFNLLPQSIYSGNQITIILWGDRALAFEGERLLQLAEKEPVIAIFVGTLVKPYQGQYFPQSRSDISASLTSSSTNLFPILLFTGQRGLSGSAPCRWYINEDLPEINELRAR